MLNGYYFSRETIFDGLNYVQNDASVLVMHWPHFVFELSFFNDHDDDELVKNKSKI